MNMDSHLIIAIAANYVKVLYLKIIMTLSSENTAKIENIFVCERAKRRRELWNVRYFYN